MRGTNDITHKNVSMKTPFGQTKVLKDAFFGQTKVDTLKNALVQAWPNFQVYSHFSDISNVKL